jgi:pyruvate/2-oxoglutarate/acetoin dehydrogenase E1 component
MRYIDQIRKGLDVILEKEPYSIVLGEDISDPYGGAFKVTKGLSTKYPDKIIQTPISEAGFTGVAVGLAYKGFNPIVEIMFGDFLTHIVDILINSASKFPWYSNNEITGKILIRTPVGARRGYGPIHSQSLEKLFFGWPGITIIAPNIITDPKSVLAAAYELESPVKIFLENKQDYPAYIMNESELEKKGFYNLSELNIKNASNTLQTIIITNVENGVSPDVTICCYGGMLRYALDAAYTLLMEEEIYCHICVPTKIFPLETGTLLSSINKTGKIVFVEEGYSEAGWGAYAFSKIVESGDCQIKVDKTRFVGPRFSPIPANIEHEQNHLPDTNSIIKAAKDIL